MRSLPRPLDDRGPTCRRGAVGGDEGADAVERVGGDAAAVAQPGGELAVIDSAPAEGRLGKPGVPAIVGNFLQQVLSVHDWASDAGVASLPSLPPACVLRASVTGSEPRDCVLVNHKPSHYGCGMNDGMFPMQDSGGYSIS